MKKLIIVTALSLTGYCSLQAAQVTGDEPVIGIGPNLQATGQGNGLTAGGYNSIADGGAGKPWYGIISGGTQNRIHSHGYLLTGVGTNAVTLEGYQKENRNSVIAGGSYNTIFDTVDSSIGGGNLNIIEPWGNYSVIGGGHKNVIRYGSGYSVISGGTENTIDRGAWWGSINGGQNNHISGTLSTTNTVASTNIASGSLVAGRQYVVVASGGGTVTPTGLATHANGQVFIAVGTTFTKSGNAYVADAYPFQHWGWIGGGFANVITNKGSSLSAGQGGSIGGGFYNQISARVGTIGGGYTNGVAGEFATVPGGSWNHANGINAFAAGRHAHANHNGSFVWGDYHPTWDGTSAQDVESPADNTFSARATGGFWFGGMGSGPSTSNIPAGAFINTQTGAYLDTAGQWQSVSDRNAKEKFVSIDSKNVLKKLKALPIQQWKYKIENGDVRHIGPVAQDFYAAFELGTNEKAIGTVDADGVALAAIQGLNLIVEEKDAKIRELEERLLKLESVILKQ